MRGAATAGVDPDPRASTKRCRRRVHSEPRRAAQLLGSAAGVRARGIRRGSRAGVCERRLGTVVDPREGVGRQPTGAKSSVRPTAATVGDPAAHACVSPAARGRRVLFCERRGLSPLEARCGRSITRAGRAGKVGASDEADAGLVQTHDVQPELRRMPRRAVRSGNALPASLLRRASASFSAARASQSKRFTMSTASLIASST